MKRTGNACLKIIAVLAGFALCGIAARASAVLR